MTIRFFQMALVAITAFTLVACDSSDPGGDLGDALEGMQRRLLVAESGQPALHVIDVEDGQAVGKLGLAGPIRAYMHAEESGRYAFLGPTNGPLTTIDAGIFVQDGSVVKQAPTVHAFEVPGENLIHVTYAEHTVAGWYDGTGEARLFDAREVVASGTASVMTLDSGAPHHGVAVSLGPDMALTTTPPPEGDFLPAGVAVRSLPTGDEIASYDGCPGLHGEAHAANGLVGYGCADGILFIQRQGATATATKVANPASVPEGSRTSIMHGHEDVPYIVAHYSGPEGEDLGPIAYDPSSGQFSAFELTGDAPWFFGYGFSPEGREFLALGADGRLHIYNGQTRALLGTVDGVTSGAAPSADDPFARSRIAVGAHYAYVSDPVAKTVTEVKLSSREITRTWTLDFAPTVLALVGTDEALPTAQSS